MPRDWPTSNFEHIKPGDNVLRMIGGEVPMKLVVSRVDDTFIYCGTPDGQNYWKFFRKNGAEVDEALGWDGVTITGSVLVRTDES